MKREYSFPMWPMQSYGQYAYSLWLFGGYTHKEAAVETIKLQRFF